MSVIIEAILPKSYLQDFLQNCSQIKFESKLTPRPQFHTQMFYPFYYKDPFVHDCIFELKERNSSAVARLFGGILSRWVVRKIEEVMVNYHPNTYDCHPCGGRDPESRTRNWNIRNTTKSNYCSGDVFKQSASCLDPCLRRDDKLENGDDKLGNEHNVQFYLIPVPQHISKTKEKGFCHTTTLTISIETILKKKYPTTSIQFFPCIKKIKKTKRLHDTFGKKVRFKIIQETMKAHVTKEDAQHAYFFIIDDVYTTGATFKEIRRSLSDCAVPHEHVFFVSIAH